jgi:DNA polymerase-3 subunit alpha
MKVVIFDTETTGLIKNRSLPLEKLPEIIEFYGCVVDTETGKIEKEFECLLKPKHIVNSSLPPIIEEITGLNYKDDLAGSPLFAQHKGEILELLSSGEMVIAHNASYDQEMVDIELKRLGETFDWPMVRCTIQQTKHFTGKWMNLASLYEYLFEEKFENAHRAKNDVKALTRIVLELFDRQCL